MMSLLACYLWLFHAYFMTFNVHLWLFNKACGDNTPRFNVTWMMGTTEVTDTEACAYHVTSLLIPLMLSIGIGLFMWSRCRGGPKKRLQ